MKLKRCAECKQVKKTTAFHHNKSSPDGRTRCCKDCNCAASRKYTAANAGKTKKRKRKYRMENQQKIKNKRHKYYKEHQDKEMAKARQYTKSLGDCYVRSKLKSLGVQNPEPFWIEVKRQQIVADRKLKNNQMEV